MDLKKEIDDYIREVERLYRRSLDTPINGLTNSQVEEIKRFQFVARENKRTIAELMPQWLREINNAKALLLLANLKPEDYPPLADAFETARRTIATHREELRTASKILNNSLSRRGRPEPLTERDLVNPIDCSLPPAEKADMLLGLAETNLPFIENFTKQVDEKYNAKSKFGKKEHSKILDKATRPAIKADKEWFQIEHIRDSLRFKTALSDIADLPKILDDLKRQGVNFVKCETQKMLKPKVWGWRAVMYDLRMPNGLLVEYYLAPKELIDANENICHKLYEDWRSRDTQTLTVDELKQYQQALETSRSTYRDAWESYLKRTGQSVEFVKSVLTEADQVSN